MLLMLLLNLAVTVDGFDHYKRCLLHQGKCVTHCPRNLYPYHTRCDRDTLSQRTCDMPDVYSLGYTCGWSRCDCIGELLLDETTGHCVETEQCPDTRHVHRRRSGSKIKGPMRPRRKKIRFSEGVIPDME